MPQDPKRVVELLTTCMDLPQINDAERGLLRSMAHAWGMGQQALWGASNPHLEPIVFALFVKCQALLCSTPSPTV